MMGSAVVFLAVACATLMNAAPVAATWYHYPWNQLFSGPTTPNYCNIGPSYWCMGKKEADECMVSSNTPIQVCGFSSKNNCNYTSTIGQFCRTYPSATSYKGGITGSPAGYFGYYALALSWSPSGCNANGTGSYQSCSPLTGTGTFAAKNLVLHGLWPDYGSIYASKTPTVPPFTGSYQGWPQYCNVWGNGPNGFTNYAQCHVSGGLCPWANATDPTFGQADYERCIRVMNKTLPAGLCQVPASTFDALYKDMVKFAPGYLAGLRDFADHEYFKHGSCIGGYLSYNITAYFDVAIKLTKTLVAPGTPAYEIIHKYAGRNITRAALEVALDKKAAPTCKKDCKLDEIWYCFGRDASGFPTALITCPAGTLTSNSCASNNCTRIFLPTY